MSATAMKARHRKSKPGPQAKAIPGPLAKIGTQVVTYSLIALVLIYFLSQI